MRLQQDSQKLAIIACFLSSKARRRHLSVDLFASLNRLLCSIEQDPELRISSELPLQTNSLHFTNFDAQYRSSADEPITRRAIDINSGAYRIGPLSLKLAQSSSTRLGKVLGGSTCINYCIWTRGPKGDHLSHIMITALSNRPGRRLRSVGRAGRQSCVFLGRDLLHLRSSMFVLLALCCRIYMLIDLLHVGGNIFAVVKSYICQDYLSVSAI